MNMQNASLGLSLLLLAACAAEVDSSSHGDDEKWGESPDGDGILQPGEFEELNRGQKLSALVYRMDAAGFTCGGGVLLTALAGAADTFPFADGVVDQVAGTVDPSYWYEGPQDEYHLISKLRGVDVTFSTGYGYPEGGLAGFIIDSIGGILNMVVNIVTAREDRPVLAYDLTQGAYASTAKAMEEVLYGESAECRRHAVSVVNILTYLWSTRPGQG